MTLTGSALQNRNSGTEQSLGTSLGTLPFWGEDPIYSILALLVEDDAFLCRSKESLWSERRAHAGDTTSTFNFSSGFKLSSVHCDLWKAARLVSPKQSKGGLHIDVSFEVLLFPR